MISMQDKLQKLFNEIGVEDNLLSYFDNASIEKVVIYDGNIGSVAREKDQVKEVKQGLECGITIEGYNDIKEGDIIEAYEIVEVKR